MVGSVLARGTGEGQAVESRVGAGLGRGEVADHEMSDVGLVAKMPADGAGVLVRAPGRGGRELGHPQQPANGIERGSDMHIRVGAPPPVMARAGACVSTMVTVIPFSG